MLIPHVGIEALEGSGQERSVGARLARAAFLEKETQKVGSYLRVWIWGGERSEW